MFDWLNKNSSSSKQTERTRLMSLSEKELMVEMILELKRISSKCDEIGRKIVIWSNQNYKNLNRSIKENGFGGRIKISFRSRFFSDYFRMWSPIVVKHVVKGEKWACSTPKAGKNKPVRHIVKTRDFARICEEIKENRRFG